MESKMWANGKERAATVIGTVAFTSGGWPGSLTHGPIQNMSENGYTEATRKLHGSYTAAVDDIGAGTMEKFDHSTF